MSTDQPATQSTLQSSLSDSLSPSDGMTTPPSVTPSLSGAQTVGHRIREVHPGDLLFFPRKEIHALAKPPDEADISPYSPHDAPSELTLNWLDGYNRSTSTQSIRQETLAEMASDNRLRLVAEDISDAEDLNRALGVRHPSHYHRDGTVQPGPRLPVAKLTFERICSLNRVNGFLKHPLIDHKQGRVQKAKGVFLATRPDGRIAAAATLNSVNARMAFDRHTVEITRYASHPETARPTRTNNTATWMLSRICQWAALEGYETIRTYAGTDGNDGQIYRAANFTYDGDANSSGSYNRDGRINQSHDTTLKRYLRHVSVDGDSAQKTIPRRVESRLETDSSGHGDMTSLSAFSNTSPPRTPANFQFTREEASDNKFTAGDTDNQYPFFSDQLHQLVAETDTPITLSNLTAARGRHTPAAALGAVVDGDLVAAILLRGNPTASDPTATVSGYAATDTAYPDATARWLLSRARDWALLDGYDTVVVPANTFSHLSDVNETVPLGVGFSADGHSYHYSK